MQRNLTWLLISILDLFILWQGNKEQSLVAQIAEIRTNIRDACDRVSPLHIYPTDIICHLNVDIFVIHVEI